MWPCYNFKFKSENRAVLLPILSITPRQKCCCAAENMNNATKTHTKNPE